MIKVNIQFICYLTFVHLAFHSAHSQCKDITASAGPAVIEKKALFDDLYKAKDFNDAKAPLNWLLRNAPTLGTNLYITGADTFDELAKSEKDGVKKRNYIDSLMVIYDLRIKNCGEEANVTNRKALSFLFYNYDDAVRAKEILPLVDRAIELNDDKILDGLAENYMRAVKISADAKQLNDNQILERYEKITGVIDTKIRNAQTAGKPVDRYKKMNEDNIAVLSSLIDVNCDFVRNKLGPQFKANPSNINLAKNIFNFMLKDKCTDDPLWLQAAEVLHGAEKDYGLSKILAMRYLSSKDLDKAAKTLDEGLQLATTPSDKAEIFGLQGHLAQLKGNNVQSRDLYLKALALDHSKKEFYERIGDMYLNSFKECSEGKHQAQDRLVFLVAYDMYQKANDTQKMNDAKSSFPSVEEIFELNLKKGEKIKVACWINEETIIRTRN